MRLMHVTTVDLSLRFLLREQLVAFKADGFDVIGVSSPGPWTADLERAGLAHHAVPSLRRSWSPTADLFALIHLVRLFRRCRPFIVHTHTPKAGVLGRISARLAGVPIVVNTVHGLYGGDGGGAGRWLLLLLEGLAARFSDFEFCQSLEDLQTLRRLRLVSSARSAYLGNGVDLRRFDPFQIERAIARSHLGIPEDALVIGTLGRLVWEKGFREFFALAERLRQKHAHVLAMVVGPLEPEKHDGVPSSVIEDLSARRIVRFLGMQSDTPSIYRAMDIFVLASHREGFPRSAIEAAAMGLPLVLTDIRGCREVVSDGVNGFLVPPRDVDTLLDRVDRLIIDGDLRARFGMESRRRALAHFDEARVIRETLRMYRRLLATKLGPGDGYHTESTAAG